MTIQTIYCPGPKSLQKLIDYADPGGRITVHPDDLVVHQSHEWTKKCDWCGAEWHASKFHPGSCGECGGPR